MGSIFISFGVWLVIEETREVEMETHGMEFKDLLKVPNLNKTNEDIEQTI